MRISENTFHPFSPPWGSTIENSLLSAHLGHGMKVLPEFQVSRFSGLGWALMSQSVSHSVRTLPFIYVLASTRGCARVEIMRSQLLIYAEVSQKFLPSSPSQSNLCFTILGVKFSETLK